MALLSAAAAVLLCWGKEALTWLWLLPAGFLGCFLALAVLVFGITMISTAAVQPEKEQEKDSKYYRFLIRLLAEAAHPILGMRVHTTGLEKTPKDTRFLLVCNHLFDFDPVVLIHHFRNSQLAFISKRENSSMFVVGKLMHKIQCQLINRENDREALKTILNCIRIIKEDKASIAVFPEGYTSRDHKFHTFRSGVFKIAQKAGVPVVICTITNTHKVLGNLKRLKPTDIELHLVDVITPEAYAGMTTVELGNLIHEKMAADLGEEYAPEENT
jgi:1-acyl-sn-glycerol-3-phosphate acyltransferase